MAAPSRTGPMPRAVAEAMPAILASLPAAAPGLSARQIHERLGDVPFCAATLRLALYRLERDGQVASDLGIGPRRRETRFYWRAPAALAA